MFKNFFMIPFISFLPPKKRESSGAKNVRVLGHLMTWHVSVGKVRISHIHTTSTWRLQKKDLILSQTTNFRLFQTKSLQTTILTTMKMGESSSKRVENTVGKGEIARNEQFLLFP